MWRTAIAALVCVCLLTAAGKQKLPADKAAERQLKRSCTGCHDLDVVRAQRLSRHDWNRELTKMTLMGAWIADREAMLEYLEKKYGETRHTR
ncbi:MAG: hypothetical protein U0Q18_27855 [Bryobacteraceae bacterium]